MEVITASARETQEFGKSLSAELKPGSVVALEGDLGAGKTTLVQGIAEGLEVKGRINSPTFIIMRNYEDFYHVDLYRLEGKIKQEITDLGLLDIIQERKSIVVIEWAEKIKELLPKNTVWVKMENIEENKRKIIINKR